jgi:hypothetical protein
MSSPLLITTIITSIFSAIGGFFIGLKIKFCKCFCIECECQRTPPQTPNETSNIETKKSFRNIFKRTKRKDDDLKTIE